MKFSIILPIYNVERYLKECIESILNQSYKDYELILVDDGSPDNCPAICDEYAEIYPFIKVIHKKNGGLSDARNAGMEQAQGEYIVFVDSDDYIIEGCLQKLAERIESNKKADVIHMDLCTFYDGETVLNYSNVNRENNFYDNSELFITNAIDKGTIRWSAVANAWSNRFIKDKGVVFSKGLVGAEDFDFFFKVMRHNPTVLDTDIVITAYRLSRSGSITTDDKLSAVTGRLEIFKNHYNHYRSLRESDFKGYMLDFISMLFCKYSLKVHKFKGVERRQLLDIIKCNKHIIKRSCRFKDKVYYLISRIIGFYAASVIVMWLISKKS